MIEVQSLTRRFGDTTAVDDVSFRIDDHEIVGLLGHNGAGKTTIMRMLCGYLEPSGGSITVDGTALASQPRQIQKTLGYLPENLPVYPEMMVADYLEYAATLKGIGRRDRLAAVGDALTSTDLQNKALEPIGILSRGFKQRVGVAQAILGRPRLLVLDEPTNGLDPNQTGHMRRLIKRMAQQSTVILSTHIMQEVSAVCDRVLILRDGKLALDRSLSELQDSKTLLLRLGDCTASLLAQLRLLPSVASVEEASRDGDMLRLAVELHGDSDLDSAANEVSHLVVNGGAKLYEVDLPSRDLERIFREVYDRGD